MRILVACEFSGTVRRAFREKGHDAWSCDLLPSDDDSHFHIQADVKEALYDRWDRVIAHPPCDYLTISAEWAYTDGPYHQKVKPETLVGPNRRAARDEAVEFFRMFLECGAEQIAIENPIGCISSRICKPTQVIQPHWFGEDASKSTCLWLKGLPPLKPTEHFPPRIVEHPKGSGKMVKRWSNQTDSGQNNLSPGPNRWKLRSKTFSGIAKAMAEQWI